MKRFKAVYLLPMLSAMLLALMFAGCDLFENPVIEPQTTPLTITGKDSQENIVVVEFTKPVSASIAAKAAAMENLASNYSYKISMGASVVSSGKIIVDIPNITFNPTPGSGGTSFGGTYNGGLDLTFTIPNLITGFYVPNVTKVAKPVANPPTSTAFELPKSVSLSSATSAAEIWYTIDGSEPTTLTGTKYVTGIPIQVTKYEKGAKFVIKAIAVKNNMVQSEVMTQEYSRDLEAPKANTSSGIVLDRTTITLSSIPGAKIKYTYTTNGVEPPPPTYSGSNGFSDGVTSGTDNSITIVFNGNNPFKIKAMAIRDGYTNSPVVPFEFNKQTPISEDGKKDMFGADDGVAINDTKKTITITKGIRATGNIVIDDGWALKIEKDEGALTVPSDRTIEVSGTGKLEVKGKLEVNGNVTLKDGGTLKIDAAGTIDKLNNPLSTPTTPDGELKGSGKITVESGGKIYLPDVSVQVFTLRDVTGSIVVNAGGELWLLGAKDGNDTEYPLIGTENTKLGTKKVGADIAVQTEYITLKVFRVNGSVLGSSVDSALPYMVLHGTAKVLGPFKVDSTTTRDAVVFQCPFTVSSGAELTIGDGTTASELEVKSPGNLVNSSGTVRVSKKSKIKTNDTSLINGSIADTDDAAIKPKAGTGADSGMQVWYGTPPA